MLLVLASRGATADERCTEVGSGNGFIQIERNGDLEERRLSMSAPPFELRPGVHEFSNVISCTSCAPKVDIGAISVIAAEDDYAVANGRPERFFTRYWPQLRAVFDEAETTVRATGRSREIAIGALNGSAVEYSRILRGDPVETFVLFSATDGCVAVAALTATSNWKVSVTFDDVANKLAQLRIEAVEPGSTLRQQRQNRELLKPSQPAQPSSLQPFTVEDLRRALTDGMR